MSASAGPGQLLGSLLPLALPGTSIHRAVQVGRLGPVALVTATVGTVLTARRWWYATFVAPRNPGEGGGGAKDGAACGHDAYKRSEALSRRCRERASVLLFIVAVAGFEPATSGL